MNAFSWSWIASASLNSHLVCPRPPTTRLLDSKPASGSVCPAPFDTAAVSRAPVAASLLLCPARSPSSLSKSPPRSRICVVGVGVGVYHDRVHRFVAFFDSANDGECLGQPAGDCQQLPQHQRCCSCRRHCRFSVSGRCVLRALLGTKPQRF